MDIDLLISERDERDRFFADHYASPIPEGQRAAFTGLEYFAPDPVWEIDGRFEAVDPHKVPIPSTTGTESPYTMVGRVILSIGDDAYTLTVLDDGDGSAFIPFRDGTSGRETYGGGRYVGIDPAADGDVVVDFNTAKNPWCVYDEDFVCPLPPQDNWISDPIPAGEKMYEAAGP
jgi:uncharacterized protein (DUF1684 family)